MSIEDEILEAPSEAPGDTPAPAAPPRKSRRDRWALALGVIAVAAAIFFVVQHLIDAAPSVSQADIRSDLGLPDGGDSGDSSAASPAGQPTPDGTPADPAMAGAPSEGLTAPPPQTSQGGTTQANPAMMGDGLAADTPNQADRR